MNAFIPRKSCFLLLQGKYSIVSLYSDSYWKSSSIIFFLVLFIGYFLDTYDCYNLYINILSSLYNDYM